MKNYLIILFVLLIFLCGRALSQKILVLEKTGRFKTHMYYQGSSIAVGLDDKLVYGVITLIRDSLITVNDNFIFRLNKVKYVSRERFWVNYFSSAARLLGLTYFTLTGFNRLINKQYPVWDSQSLLISGALFVGAVILDFFGYRKISLGEKWQLKIIDLSL